MLSNFRCGESTRSCEKSKLRISAHTRMTMVYIPSSSEILISQLNPLFSGGSFKLHSFPDDGRYIYLPLYGISCFSGCSGIYTGTASMPRKPPRIEIAGPAIFDFFDQSKKRVYTGEELRTVLYRNRATLELPDHIGI